MQREYDLSSPSVPSMKQVVCSCWDIQGAAIYSIKIMFIWNLAVILCEGEEGTVILGSKCIVAKYQTHSSLVSFIVQGCQNKDWHFILIIFKIFLWFWHWRFELQLSWLQYCDPVSDRHHLLHILPGWGDGGSGDRWHHSTRSLDTKLLLGMKISLFQTLSEFNITGNINFMKRLLGILECE